MVGSAIFAGACRKQEGSGPAGKSPADWAADLERLTKGSPVRMVWLDAGTVRAFDSSAPTNPATVREAPGLQRPLIGSDGSTTVFSEGGKIQAVTWPAGQPRVLADGMAADVWRDPEAKVDWVYKAPTEAGESLTRFRLMEPARTEPVWEKGRFDPRSVQLARDGKRFGAVFFDRHAAVADIGPKEWVAQASQPLMAYAADDSGLMAVVDSTGRRIRFIHSEAQIYEVPVPEGPTHIEVLETLPTFKNRRLTAVRWTNHPRFLVASSLPVAGNGPGEVALIRLAETLDGVEDAAAIGAGGNPEQPDAWIGGGETAPASSTIAQQGRLKGQVDDPQDAELTHWPSILDGLHFLWESDREINLLPGRKDPCRVEAKGFARFGQWGEMIPDGGTFSADSVSVKEFVQAAAKSNAFTVEMLIGESVQANGSVSGRICALQLDDQRDAFSLSRVDDGLVLRVLLQDKDQPAREYQTVLGPMKVAQNVPISLSFECVNGAVDWRVGGSLIAQPFQLGGQSIAAWASAAEPKWVFGDDEPRGVAGWQTTLQRVLAYSRSLPPQNRAMNGASAAAGFSARAVTYPIRLQARLLQTAPAAGASASPPTQLAQCVYDVVSVHSGRFEAKKIAVFHYRTINGSPCPEWPAETGKTYELMIVPLAERRDAEVLPMALTDGGFSLPQYFSVMSPKRPLPVVEPPVPKPATPASSPPSNAPEPTR